MEEESISPGEEELVLDTPDQQEVDEAMFFNPEQPQPGPESQPDSEVFLQLVIQEAGEGNWGTWEKTRDSTQDDCVQVLDLETRTIKIIQKDRSQQDLTSSDIASGKVATENPQKYSVEVSKVIDALIKDGEYVFQKKTTQSDGAIKQEAIAYRLHDNNVIYSESYARIMLSQKGRLRSEQDGDDVEEIESDDEAGEQEDHLVPIEQSDNHTEEPLLVFSLLPSREESTQKFEAEPRATEELPSPAEVPNFEFPEGIFPVAGVPSEAGIVLVREVAPNLSVEKFGTIMEQKLTVTEVEPRTDEEVVVVETQNNIPILSSIEVLSGDIAMTFQEAKEEAVSTLEKEPMPSVSRKEEVRILEISASPRVVDVEPALVTRSLILPSIRESVEFESTPIIMQQSELREEVYEVASRTHSEVKDEHAKPMEEEANTSILLSMEVVSHRATETRDENNGENGSEEDRGVQGRTLEREPFTPDNRKDREEQKELVQGTIPSPEVASMVQQKEIHGTPPREAQVVHEEMSERPLEVISSAVFKKPEITTSFEAPRNDIEKFIRGEVVAPLRLAPTPEVIRKEVSSRTRGEALSTARSARGFNPSGFTILDEDPHGIRLVREERRAA